MSIKGTKPFDYYPSAKATTAAQETETRHEAPHTTPVGKSKTDGTPVDNIRSSAAGLNLFEITRQKPSKPADEKAADAAATSIRKATGRDNLVDISTDEETIITILKDKSLGERQAIARAYQRRFGVSLEQELRSEMDGGELERALAYLQRKDNSSIDATTLKAALDERQQILFGRSSRNCEKDIRDTISTMNSSQLADLDQEYRAKYGKSVRDAISEAKLSDETRRSLSIYLKGTEKRTDDDTLQLAEIALSASSMDMFQETMRSASFEARRRFMHESRSEEKLRAAFGSGDDFRHATDYAKNGKLSSATKVRDNTQWNGDNEKAIEAALQQMTQAERRLYIDGKALSTGRAPSGLTADQRQESIDYYRQLHSALKAAGNETEMHRWEDMIDSKNGSLVSKIAARRSFWGTDVDSLLTDIETIDSKDWLRLKQDHAYRKKVEDTLGTFLSESEMKRAKEVIARKTQASSFEAANEFGRRDLLDAVKDNTNRDFLWLNNREDKILCAIENMTPAERLRYQRNSDYRKALDSAIAGSMEAGPERDAAMQLLGKVLKGEKPKQDIVTKMNMHAAQLITDKALLIRDLQTAFREDPTLRTRITNPQSPEDKELSQRFDRAIRTALDSEDYSNFAQPLIQTGRLSLAKQRELCEHTFDDDEQGFYKDVLNLALSKDSGSQRERDLILNNQQYREAALGSLNEKEREIALNILSQGEFRPEDKIRSQMIGIGTGEEEIKTELRQLTPEQLAQAKQNYARKYGADILADFLDEMGGQDAVDTLRISRKVPATDRESFNEARSEYYKSRDGLGRTFVDRLWDGTGYMADDAGNQYARSITKASAQFKSLSTEEREHLREGLEQNLDLFKESKAAAAEKVVDGVIIASSVAAAGFTGGLSLSLLAKTAALGAAFKLATKSAIMGTDYDWASSQTIVDLATGSIDAASVVVGPAQLANICRMGERAASTASKALLIENASLLRSHAQKVASKRITELVAKGISDGCRIDERAISGVAKELASDGNEKLVEYALKKHIQKALENESRGALRNTIRETTLNSASGAVGGGASGGVRGASEWDSSKSIGENLAHLGEQASTGAVFGAGIAGGSTIVLKGAGAALSNRTKALSKLSVSGETKVGTELQDAGLKTGSQSRVASWKIPDDVKRETPLRARAGKEKIEVVRDSAGSPAENQRMRIADHKPEVSNSHPRIERGERGELKKVTFPDGKIAEHKNSGWVEYYPAGHARAKEGVRKLKDTHYREDAGGILVKSKLTEETLWKPDGSIDTRPNPNVFKVSGEVSDEFVRRVEVAYLMLPEEIRELLALDGHIVMLGKLSTDIKPELKGKTPRGWDASKTWTQAEGLHDPVQKMIVVAEEYRLDVPHVRIFGKSPRVEGVLRHEVGHAVDQALRLASDSKVRAAYQKDMTENFTVLSKQIKERLKYFDQRSAGSTTPGSDAGLSETLAELFGVIKGGGGSKQIEQDLIKAFPNVKKELEAALGDLIGN